MRLRHHMIFTQAQVQSFDRAWNTFLTVSAFLFALIVASPLIKEAWTGPGEVWMLVPALVAWAAAGFWAVGWLFGRLRVGQYNCWENDLRFYQWFDFTEHEVESRIIGKALAKALEKDLDALEKTSPHLAPKIAQLRRLGLEVQRRDVRAMAKELASNGLPSSTQALASPEICARRRAYVDKALRRLDLEGIEKRSWEEFERMLNQEGFSMERHEDGVVINISEASEREE